MKRIVALLLLLLFLLSFFVSCEEKEGDTPSDVIDGCWPGRSFETFEAFEAYANDAENQDEYAKIDKNAVVNFDSIIPNEEIGLIKIYQNYYEIIYRTGKDGYHGFWIYVEYKYTPESEGNVIRCEEPIENTDISQEGRYVFNVNGTDVYYNVNKYGVCQFITFRLSNYEFSLVEVNRIILSQNTTEAQKAFINAFMTEAGTADMLDRIAALIPTET